MTAQTKIGIVGHGAVGSVLARSLAAGEVPGWSLAGVYAHSEVPDAYRFNDFGDLVAASHTVIEAASQAAVAAYGPPTLEAGRDLVVVSVGALCDGSLLDSLLGLAQLNGRRLLVTTGAIGGLDILRAAQMLGPLDTVTLSSVKPARAVIQPWMEAAEIARLHQSTEPVRVFAGSARDAARLFPRSANVAAALSLTTIGFDRVRVEITADPAATTVRHTVLATGSAGTYSFTFENVPSPLNIRTSAVTPYAVLRGLRDATAAAVLAF